MRSLLLSGAVLALLFGASFPAMASQRSIEDLADDEEGNLVSAPPPETDLTEDGFLVIEGDVFVDCRSAIRLIEKHASSRTMDAITSSEVEEARTVARQCREAGFGGEERREFEALPETGGVSWAIGSGAFTVIAGLLIRGLIHRR